MKKAAVVVEEPAPELPSPPKLRPRVVEPVAGDTGTAVTTDPGLEDVGPKPTRAASGARPRRAVGHTDITTATALANGVALPPLEAPEEVKQIIEAGNIIARSPGGGGDPVRHVGPPRHRLALGEHHAQHERVRRPPPRRPLIG